MERLFLSVGEVDRLKIKYPDRIPIFVTKGHGANIPDIPKHKFLVISNLPLSEFVWVIREQIQLPPEKALFIFVNNTFVSTNSLISELYSIYKSPDGALRMTYTLENTFS